MLTTAAPGINSVKNISLRVYTKEDVEEIWEHIIQMLERSVSVSKGMMSIKLMQELINDGSAAAFVTFRGDVVESAIICSVVNYAYYRSARILACGGKNLHHAMQNFDALQSWSLLNECKEIEGWVEPEMCRYLRRFGFKPKKTIVSFDLRSKLQ